MSVQSAARQPAAISRVGYSFPENGDRRLWTNYLPHGDAWDELFRARSVSQGLPTEGAPSFAHANGFDIAHDHCQSLVQWLGELAISDFQERRRNADLVFINQGITFSV